MVTSKKSTARKKAPALPKINTSEAQRGGLGRGLASLIPQGAAKPRLGDAAADVILGSSRHSDVSAQGDNKSQSQAQKKKTTAAKESKSFSAHDSGTNGKDSFGAYYQEIPISAIRANDHQPRTVFDEEPLQELVTSITNFGVMQPIVVRTDPKGKGDTYELIMGERRFRASTLAGLETIPAIVRQTEDEDMLRDALLENIHRVQLNPLEEAAAYQQLLEDFGVTHDELADRIGRSRPVVTNSIRLLTLPVTVQRKVGAGVLSAGHAKVLLGLKDSPTLQEELADRIVAEAMSVRSAEEAVHLMKNASPKPNKKKVQDRTLPDNVDNWMRTYGDALDTKVSVAMGNKGRGKIIIEFGDLNDFERISELMNMG